MIEDIVLFTSIFHFRGLAGYLDDLKGFGSDLDFSCGLTNGLTEVFQEVLADLKNDINVGPTWKSETS